MSNKTILSFRNPTSPLTEAYRILRTNLLYRNFEKELKVINVISTNPQEGKSSTILNLAAVFSQMDKKVLVIDMDLRNPSIHKKLKYKNTIGITDLITGNTTLDQCTIHYTEYMDVIFAGTKIPFASEFVQSKALNEFITSQKENYDLIFIDCPPVSLVTDGAIISNFCDGTLLVVASNKNDRKELLQTKDLLEMMKVNVLGVVFTQAHISRKSYHYSYGVDPNAKKKKDRKVKFAR